jgi:exopolysaccharide biosynthesis WecB/TagA/CpsF family protein
MSTIAERILLVQFADMGDLILITPAIAALREARPAAHLTLLTSHHVTAILEDGLVNEVLTFGKSGFNGTLALLNTKNLARIWKLRNGNYDAVVFFHRFTLKIGTLKFCLIARASAAKHIYGLDNGNGWFLTDSIPDEGFGVKHNAQYWLDLVGLLGASTEPQRARIPMSGDVLPISVKRSIRVIIHAGGGAYSTARRWFTERLAQVADSLHEEFGAEIILVGAENDDAAEVVAAMQYKALNLSGKTSLKQLADVIRSADLYIGTDSGVTHLAAGVRTPVIAIYGPSNHEAWSPWSPGGIIVILRSAPECSPCMYAGHEIGLREGCPARTCMHMVEPHHVLENARAILNNEKIPQFDGYPFDSRHNRDWTDRVQILSLPVDRITYKKWLNLIDKWVKTGTRVHHVCTINPEFMIMAQRDTNFANILRRADLCVPDGAGLLWAANVLKNPLPERVTGSDGVPMIAKEAAKRGWKLFFLGAAEGVAEEAAYILQAEYEGLQVVGTYSGSPAPEEEDEIVAMVNASAADILLVAYGAPNQDKWIARNMPRLHVKMAMGVGGTFDFITGRVPRAPAWMQMMYLEWLYRLIIEPWRIWRMMRLPRFVVAVILRGAN